MNVPSELPTTLLHLPCNVCIIWEC